MKAISFSILVAIVVFVAGCSNPPEEFGTFSEEGDRISSALGIDCSMANLHGSHYECGWSINVWGDDFVTKYVTISKGSASLERLGQLGGLYGFSEDQVERVVNSNSNVAIEGRFRLRSLRQQYRIDYAP